MDVGSQSITLGIWVCKCSNDRDKLMLFTTIHILAWSIGHCRHRQIPECIQVILFQRSSSPCVLWYRCAPDTTLPISLTNECTACWLTRHRFDGLLLVDEGQVLGQRSRCQRRERQAVSGRHQEYCSRPTSSTQPLRFFNVCALM